MSSLNRRRFIGVAATTAFAATADLRVNGARLRENLEALSAFGRPAGGSFADGVSRVAYSEADLAGRAYVMGLLKSAGLQPRVDAAGNILARRTGTNPALAPVLFGSHIDSVPSGGNFDGDLGSLAAIEVIRTLNEAKLTTKRPLEVVVWTNEEGVAFNNGLAGSRAASGHLASGELDEVWNGLKKSDAIRRIGGNPDRIEDARRTPGSFHCYLELHIEQGGTLEKAGLPIGVVEGIVAIDRYAVEIRGLANHAGTTAMPERRDALLAAAYLTVAVNEIVRREPGRQVGTVGQLNVTPNAPNVIPGLVKMTVELRDLSAAKIAKLGEAIRARARDIGALTATGIELKAISHHNEALADSRVKSVIEGSASRLGLELRHLPSGAGHDAQAMASLGPMGMIFVPSVGGISHSSKEFTRWADCARGADVLLHAVLESAA